MRDKARTDFPVKGLKPGGFFLAEGTSGFGQSIDVIIGFH